MKKASVSNTVVLIICCLVVLVFIKLMWTQHVIPNWHAKQNNASLIRTLFVGLNGARISTAPLYDQVRVIIYLLDMTELKVVVMA